MMSDENLVKPDNEEIKIPRIQSVATEKPKKV